MKLTRIAIDGIGAEKQLHLDRLSDRLNVIFSPAVSCRTRIRRFLRLALFGQESWSSPLRSEQRRVDEFGAASFLEFARGSEQFRLAYDAVGGFASHHPIHRETGSANTNLTTSLTTSQLVGGIDAAVYETFFNVAMGQTPALIPQIVRQMQSRFGVTSGPPHWPEATSYDQWKLDSQTRLAQLSSLRDRQQDLGLEKDRLEMDIHRVESQYAQRIQSLQTQLDTHQQMIRERQTRLSNLQENLRSVDARLADLRRQIDHLKTQVQHVSIPALAPDSLALLYQRLDEIDQQIRRWRQVQTDVHSERVRLRDEMATCDRLSIESTDHPYHVARQLIVSLENKVDQAENYARQNDAVVQNEREDDARWHRVTDLCGQMRQDLYSLCQELGQQYKHVRHKAAVAEMKQLRRCYHEMDENIKRLIRRREAVLAEIREIDPAGAEAIDRADQQFCACAEHEGYLEARRRYGGAWDALNLPVTQQYSVHSDWSTEQTQWVDLQRQREDLLQSIGQTESELLTAGAELNRLHQQRNLLAKQSREELQRQLMLVNEQILTLDQQIRQLTAKTEEDRRLENLAPNHLMSTACGHLSGLTNGRLTNMWIDDPGQLVIRRADGSDHSFSEMDRGQQDLACFSLIAAVVQTYVEKGVHVPLVIDELLFNLQDDERLRTIDLLSTLADQGHQVILLTSQWSATDYRGNARTFDLHSNELPDTAITRPFIEPVHIPRSEPPKPSLSSLWLQETGPTSLTGGRQHRPDEYHLPRRTPAWNDQFSSSVGIATRLSDIDLVESIYLAPLSSVGVNTIGQLLDLDPEALSNELTGRGFSRSQIDRWQAQAWLLHCLPDLRSYDARVLVACGITEPEQLHEMSAESILDRIRDYLGSTDGRRAGVNLTRYDFDRVQEWKQSLRDRAGQWNWGDHLSRRRQRGSWNRNGRDDEVRGSSGNRDHSNGRSERRGGAGRSYAGPQQARARRTETAENLRFFLNMNDDIDAAPSIGTRTADRFRQIGIESVADFLNQDAASMAERIDYKRLSANVIRSWQQQTRLMVQVPNLRAHDVQLLVGCGLTEPEEIAKMDPSKLFGMIKPYADTKEGGRILRSGKKPDLNEIKDWIDAANHHRTLQAA